MGNPHYSTECAEHISTEEAAWALLTKTTGLKNDEHGRGTAARFVRMLEELTTPQEFEFTTFPNDDGVDEMVIVKDIPFTSVCNHHVIPFVGRAWIGYIPNNRIAGLSKFARVVHYFAKRLQVQERLTQQIADEIMHVLDPLGCIVVMEAEHFCMTVRGVQAPGVTTTTSAVKGVFADHDRTAKDEFLRLIGK